MNKLIFSGNLGADLELRKTSSGQSVTNLRVCGTSRYDSENGDTVVWLSVAVFGKQAEDCCQYLAKGSKVLVEGSLFTSEWEKDGEKRSQLEVFAQRVEFLSRKDTDDDGPKAHRQSGDVPPESSARANNRLGKGGAATSRSGK